jgi:hypothetical protein
MLEVVICRARETKNKCHERFSYCHGFTTKFEESPGPMRSDSTEHSKGSFAVAEHELIAPASYKALIVAQQW